MPTYCISLEYVTTTMLSRTVIAENKSAAFDIAWRDSNSDDFGEYDPDQYEPVEEVTIAGVEECDPRQGRMSDQ